MKKPESPFYKHAGVRDSDWQAGFDAAVRAICKELRARNRWGGGSVPDRELADQIEAWDFGPVDPAAGDTRKEDTDAP